MKLFYLFIGLLLISTKVFGFMKIDFKNTDWKETLDSINGQKITSITFENYNNELDGLDFELDVKNITFENGEIKSIPKFLFNQSINYLSFSNCIINDSSINLDKLKSLSKISLFGGTINKLPKGMDKLKSLTHIFITQTSIELVKLDFSELPLLQELSLRQNKLINSFEGDFGKCTQLKEIEIFECDNIQKFDISENTSVKRIRLGSWSPEFKIQNGLESLLNLKKVVIDNYRSSNFSLDFLNGKQIEQLKVYCPTLEQISVIKYLTSLIEIGIWRQVNCSDESFLFSDIALLSNLSNLTINLGGVNTSEEFIQYITLFRDLEYVKLIDTKWNETEWKNALSNVPQSIKLDINN